MSLAYVPRSVFVRTRTVKRTRRSGAGKYPACRIFRTDAAGGEMHEGAYYDSGAPMPDVDSKSLNWSTASMSYEEVGAFFREKTNWRGKSG